MLLSHFPFAISFLSVSFAATIRKRSAMSLYSYGGYTDGFKVFYGDGLAWIGTASSAPGWLSEVSEITFNQASTTAPWTINSENSFWANGAYELYIVPTSGADDQVGFVSTGTTAPTGAVTTGFLMYGSQIAYRTSDGEVEIMFWAVETNTTDLWKLMWNQADEALADNTVVVLKDLKE